jgi:hypothetical protein
LEQLAVLAAPELAVLGLEEVLLPQAASPVPMAMTAATSMMRRM